MMFIKNEKFSDLKMAIIEEVGDSGETNYLQVAQRSSNEGVVVEGEGGVAVAPAEEEGAPQKIFGVLKSVFTRMIMFWLIMQFFKKSPGAGTGNTGTEVSKTRSPASNLYQDGTGFDMFVYISEQMEFGEFDMDESLFWKLTGLEYGKWDLGKNLDSTFEKTVQVPISDRVQNNGSLYIHTFIVKSGKSPDPKAGKLFSKKYTVYKSQRLNKFKKKQYKTTANLLTGLTEQSEIDQEKAKTIKSEIVSHWHPNLTINLVFDHTPWVAGQVPPPLDDFVEFTTTLQQYKPILWLNDYWNLQRDYMPINSSTPLLNLTLTFQPLSMFKWQMYSAQSLKNKFNMLGNLMGDMEEEDQDQDSVKEAFLETNIYLLVLTFVISIVHSVFEFLAFKNDIQFWNNRYAYFITTKWKKISCGVGLLIELWKITKVSDVSFDFENPVMGLIPRLIIVERKDYKNSGTKEFDRMAFKYLGMLCFPLGLAYCVYSVIYNEHKGWYSFVLSSCYGFLLTFGFIMMTPQLFINYKLKSVAHLPWRMMTYKALNTFIDDIFAFVIKMPTMYRLGCFRDDIVFFIFLYQKYIYKVDHTRVNEFGYSAEMAEDTGANKAVTEDTAQGALEDKSVAPPTVDDSVNEPHAENTASGDTKWKKSKSKKAKKVD
ncbi:cleft lip and palate transmembrane protein 1 homolog [Eurytemora carolleeae]|uniref:cleft lip and palate transmembrane protein 1 homolog n=1 Tax=Eurytemora carolleeae TaxID=1294199 RepID=UPI000C76650A|nr:cleft lip and palate transmembrane protein 1 homolog [Eurytemora carolleeae]|eukprot:XP_023326290.1 cleft lip and palate transmembrane protein 1 homolog [Eurytemora affinis]